MRREWTALLRDRDWTGLERLAKADPSQPLADSVGEWVDAVETKADRRALKKILYLLASAGYEPTPRDEPESPPAIGEPVVELGLMTAPTSDGQTTVFAARQSGPKVRWLVASVAALGPVVDAFGYDTKVGEVDAEVARIRKSYRSDVQPVSVGLPYALWRIKQGLSRTRSVPPSIAYWRSQVEAASEMPHPADSMDVPALDRESAETLLWDDAEAGAWRFEMSPFAKTIEAIGQALQGATELGRSDVRRIVSGFLGQVDLREEAAEHRERLRDLAMVRNIRGAADSGVWLALEREVAEKGADSLYIQVTAAKTVLDFYAAVIEAHRRERARVRRRPANPS
ncbi:MAG: hypothetical protein SNJ74_01670 [Fimbriimonadaceae bacterium]